MHTGPRPSTLALLCFCASLGGAGTVSADMACDSNEVGYVASFEAKPGSEAELEKALSTLASTVMSVEDGALFYAPYRGPDGTYFMLERYRDAAAREAHGKSPEVSALFPTLGAHLKAAPVVTPVSAVCP